jgi:hypothetical protein
MRSRSSRSGKLRLASRSADRPSFHTAPPPLLRAWHETYRCGDATVTLAESHATRVAIPHTTGRPTYPHTQPTEAPMVRPLSSVIRGALLIGVVAASASAQTTYTWTGTEAVQTLRVLRDGTPSSHLAAPKAFPGTAGSGTYGFANFSFTNTTAFTNAFLVDVLGAAGGDAAQVNTFFVAYAGSFNPANIAQNYLGDSGSSCNGPFVATVSCSNGANPIAFSVNVAAGQTVVLNLSRVSNTNTANTTVTFNARFQNPTVVVPEPSTYALMATGLIGLVGIARRRRA